ncbi:hypothetical protein [Chryseobacterium aquaticum]|uniref:Uncharacterized protein n=1 Tax=Chryseobacterium aquaticum subsp. greenlandense TaxID=345663 RepID=A0A101CLE0_9FLAO|nr:hypothetical protein [Chryseobacterium aquaticum]KUJ58343.1 hypothetical protein AR686_00625 [Chryseobacterium aquaticum subsp. greenlandense]
MKISEIATDYLVVGVLEEYEDYYDYSHSEFTIINTTKHWREIQRKRIKALSHFENDDSFNFIDYLDKAIGFFSFSPEHYPQIKTLLEEKTAFFLDAEVGEIAMLISAPYSLERVGLQICKDGTAIANAYEKTCSKEFSTVRFPLKELLK